MVDETGKKIVLYDSGRHAHSPIPLGTALLARTNIQCLSSLSHHRYLPALTLPGVGSCPYAQRTWLTLLELGLPFEARKVDLSSKPKEFVDTYHEVYPDASGKWCSGIGAYVIPWTQPCWHIVMSSSRPVNCVPYISMERPCKGLESPLRPRAALSIPSPHSCLAYLLSSNHTSQAQEVDTCCAWAQRPPRCPSS